MTEILLPGTLTDAGGYLIVNGHLVHIGPWGPEQLRDLEAAVAIAELAARLESTELAEQVLKPVSEFVARAVEGVRESVAG